MTNHSNKRRRSIRLKAYDYTQPGAYFVTVCAYDHVHLFGAIRDGVMVLNECGKMVERCWLEIPKHFVHVQLDEFVIMPNHIHGIVVIVDGFGRGNACVAATAATAATAVTAVSHSNAPVMSNKIFDTCVSPTESSGIPVPPAGKTKHPIPGSIGVIVGSFKSAASKFVNRYRKSQGSPVWQRNYYERIVRNETELTRIREYVRNNPAKWTEESTI